MSKPESSNEVRLSVEGVEDAAGRISAEFLNSPQFEVESLNQELGCSVILKVETENPVRCFKGRGIDATLSRLGDSGNLKTVVCASAGNLGQALAYCGSRHSVHAVVYASCTAEKSKIQKMQSLGADVRLVDGDFDLAREEARRFSEREGFKLIEDSEELATCEGAGTIGLELAQYPHSIDFVAIALGGGALASGVGCAFKAVSPITKVIAVQPVGAAAMAKSWQCREVVETDTADTIADGVAVRKPIQVVLTDLLALVDDAVTVQEESIKLGMRLLFEHTGMVFEPSAALGIAAVLENRDRFGGKRVATVLCGGNVDPAKFEQWVGCGAA